MCVLERDLHPNSYISLLSTKSILPVTAVTETETDSKCMPIIKPHRSNSYMLAYYYRVAWSVSMSVCLFVTFMSPAKTTKPIGMRFEELTRGAQETMH